MRNEDDQMINRMEGVGFLGSLQFKLWWGHPGQTEAVQEEKVESSLSLYSSSSSSFLLHKMVMQMIILIIGHQLLVIRSDARAWGERVVCATLFPAQVILM